MHLTILRLKPQPLTSKQKTLAKTQNTKALNLSSRRLTTTNQCSQELWEEAPASAARGAASIFARDQGRLREEGLVSFKGFTYGGGGVGFSLCF